MKYLGLILLFPVLLNAQDKIGVKWTENLTWNEIKEKAKSENKFIFLDCFTTWCGPCKRMDQQVYSNDTLAQFIQQKFLPVKLQLDKSDKDNDFVKSWYKDADYIGKQYKVISYPSFVFLTPDGTLVGKESGFKDVNDFTKLLTSILKPGRNYVNPYAKYDSLVFNYHSGKKDFKQLPYIIKTAREVGEKQFADSVGNDYYDYLLSLPSGKIYTKENIEFLASNIKKRNDKTFILFYSDGTKIDKIMGRKGYAQRVIDRVIKLDLVYPFLIEEEKNEVPHWDRLYQKVNMEFGSSLAEYAVIAGKVRWQEYLAYTKDKGYYDQYIEDFITQVRKYGSDRISFSLTAPTGGGVSFEESRDLTLEGVAWHIFKKISDTAKIQSAINWMKGVVGWSLVIGKPWGSDTRNTYACLLYKIGKRDLAIKIEEEAVRLSTEAKSEGMLKRFEAILHAMKTGIPDLNNLDY